MKDIKIFTEAYRANLKEDSEVDIRSSMAAKYLLKFYKRICSDMSDSGPVEVLESPDGRTWKVEEEYGSGALSFYNTSNKEDQTIVYASPYWEDMPGISLLVTDYNNDAEGEEFSDVLPFELTMDINEDVENYFNVMRDYFATKFKGIQSEPEETVEKPGRSNSDIYKVKEAADKACPECGTPNQFGEICSKCQRDAQAELPNELDEGAGNSTDETDCVDCGKGLNDVEIQKYFGKCRKCYFGRTE